MRVELVNTGTELLLGDTINTNAAWIGQRLAALGIRHRIYDPWLESGAPVQDREREILSVPNPQ